LNYMGKYNTVVTERDIKIFEIIKRFGYLREDLLALWLGMDWTDAKVRNNLNALASRLKQDGFIVKRKIIEGYPGYWSLGKRGATFIGGSEFRNINLATIMHTDAVSRLAIAFLLGGWCECIKTEFEIKIERSMHGKKNLKLPDLIVDDKMAIEVELSKKGDTRLSGIVANYLDSYYEKIVYYTDAPIIANRVYHFASRFGADSSRFGFKLFKNGDILQNEDYTPVPLNRQELARTPEGKFMNAVEEKLRKIGAFDK